jgi:hypothetical protein
MSQGCAASLQTVSLSPVKAWFEPKRRSLGRLSSELYRG